MKLKAGFVVAFVLCYAVKAFGQQGEIPLPPPATNTIAPNIPGVVKGGTKVQVIVDGLKQTDGPAAMADGTLLYWDLMERRIGKVGPDGKPSTFLSDTDGSSAIGFDSKGRLITILNGKPNQIGVIWPKDSKTILADSFDGKPFEAVNDLVVDKKDGVYFTLSNSGTVLYARPGAKVIKVFADPVERINGITLSRDEKTLYVATQSRVAKTTLSIADLPKEGGEHILAFDVEPDGTVKNRRNFAKYEIVIQRRTGRPMSDLGGTASRSTARTACMRQRRRASRSSAHRASTWAPFPYRGIPTTWPSRVPTRRRCTSSLAEQCTRSRCSQKGIRVGRNSRDLALPLRPWADD